MNIQDKEKIVFIGDSVTDAGRKRPVGEGLWEGTGNGYVRMIENFLNVCYPERIIHVANTGISGNTTNDLIARFDTDCLDLHPDTVVICIGFNDVWRYFDEPSLTEEHVSLETYAKNLEVMADRCRGAGVRCIFMTPYYLEPNEKDLMRAKMDEYRGAMKQVAEAKALDCIDIEDGAFFGFTQGEVANTHGVGKHRLGGVVVYVLILTLTYERGVNSTAVSPLTTRSEYLCYTVEQRALTTTGLSVCKEHTLFAVDTEERITQGSL